MAIEKNVVDDVLRINVANLKFLETPSRRVSQNYLEKGTRVRCTSTVLKARAQCSFIVAVAYA